jgi:molecular chaperone GrpE
VIDPDETVMSNEPDPLRQEPAKEIPAADEGLRQLQAERDRLHDQLVRALADLQNARKRHQREIEDVRKRAVETLARELLPVLDNFHLALAAHEAQERGQGQRATHSMIEGLRMVQSLLAGALERHGVAEIESIGTRFDPSQHEAVGIDPGAAAEPGTVTQVLQRGYALGERVLRPSKVLVAGETGAPPPEDTKGKQELSRDEGDRSKQGES